MLINCDLLCRKKDINYWIDGKSSNSRDYYDVKGNVLAYTNFGTKGSGETCIEVRV